VYRLIDPGQYRKQHVLVVGGGDSAVEAALSIAEQAEASVSLAYRGEAFSRVKPDNRLRLDQASGRQELRVLLQTEVKSIGVSTVTLGRADGEELLKNDAVIVCAGGIMPRDFLAGIGVDFEIRHGTA
jgi:thioredoxin reductase